MKTFIYSLLVITWTASLAWSDSFHDTFDSGSPGTGAGFPPGYGVFGTEVLSRGVTTSSSVSPPHAAFVTIDFSGTSFGGVMIHDPLPVCDLSDATLFAQVRADIDTSGFNGLMAFQLVDADGTTVRTSDANLFSPTTGFQEFHQRATDLTTVDAGGSDFIMDYEVVVQYGILFLDRGDIASTVSFFIDDFKSGLVPVIQKIEPGMIPPGLTRDFLITGTSTSFGPSSDVTFSGAGLTINQVTALNTTQLQVNVTADPGAAAGYRDITVTTGAEVASKLGLLQVLAAGLAFDHTFDAEPADTGAPDHFDLFGSEVTDASLTTSESVSPAQSASITLDLSGTSFGAVMIHQPLSPFTMGAATLSIQLKSSTDLSGFQGLVAFQIVDADGTTVRTADEDLFKPGSTFKTFTQSIGQLSRVDDGGADFVMDYNRIVQYAILILDRGDIENTVTLYLDNFRGITHQTPYDFDGDGQAEIGVIDPATYFWFINQSAAGFDFTQLGFVGVIPASADFDGDNRWDRGVYDPPTGTWFLELSSSPGLETRFGFPGTIPVPGDYDGDGKDDMAVYYPKSGDWFILQSNTATLRVQNWGFGSTLPVPGDYDGDGRCDIAVHDRNTGIWYILQSSNRQLRTQHWGYSLTVPYPGDFDGDGTTDVTVFEPLTGNWYILQSGSGQMRTQNWGYFATTPAAADFDGDGKTDIGVFEARSGNWYILSSKTGGMIQTNWGWSATLPIQQQTHINRQFGLP